MKRVPETQIIRETYDEDAVDDDRHGPVEPPSEASSDVLARRKIAKPRSRRANGNLSTPGGLSAFSPTASGPSTPINSNLFAPLSSTSTSLFNNALTPSTPVAATPPAGGPKADAKDDEGTFVSAGPSPSFIKLIKIRALNEKFSQAVADAVGKDKLANLVPTVKSYVAYYDQIISESKAEGNQQVHIIASSNSGASTPVAQPSQQASASTSSFSASNFSSGNTTTMSPLNMFASADKQPSITVSSTTTAETLESKKAEDTTPKATADSGSESDSDDDVKIQGPTFTAPKSLLTAPKESAFKFGEETLTKPTELKGPSFQFNVPAKFNTPNAATPSQSKSTEGPSFQFNLSAKSDTPNAVTPSQSKSTGNLAETPKPTFAFGTKGQTTEVNTFKPFGDSKAENDNNTGLMGNNATKEHATPSLAPTFAFKFSSQEDKSRENSSDESKLPATTHEEKFNPTDVKAAPSFPQLGSVESSSGTNGSPLKIASLGSSVPTNTLFGVSGSNNDKKNAPDLGSRSFEFNKAASANDSNALDSKFGTPNTLSNTAEFGSGPRFDFGNIATSKFNSSDSVPSKSGNGGNTWSSDIGIKFGGEKTLSGIKPPASPFNNPLPMSTPTQSQTPKTGDTSESNGTPTFGGSNFGSAMKSTVGFSFGTSPAGSNNSPFGTTSNSTSNAFAFPGTPGTSNNANAPVTPSASTEPKATADSTNYDGDAAPPEKQINLSDGKGPGEEDEELVFEHRGRVYQFMEAGDLKVGEDGKKPEPGYQVIGLGPVRVLKNKDTAKSRLLVRADGSGRVVINVALRKNVNYVVHNGNCVRVLDFLEGGKGVSYLIRVKEKADAEKLQKALEESKIGKD